MVELFEDFDFCFDLLSEVSVSLEVFEVELFDCNLLIR
jgi:hypothetical protein